MNKKILLSVGITILFLGITAIPLSQGTITKESNNIISDGNTLYVGGCGPNNYTSIQGAINDAIEGNTVYVFNDSSPYFENLEIVKSINLIGEDKNSTIIDGNRNSLCIWIRNSNGGRLSGFTIQNAQDEGVYVRNCDDMIFSDNIIRNNGVLSPRGPLCGMRISESKNCIVSGNIFKNNLHDGLMIFSALAEHNIVFDNVFENNANFGLLLCSSHYDIVTGNVFRNNRCGGMWVCSLYSTVTDNIFESNGIVMLYSADIDFTDLHTIENNTVNGRQIRYYKNINRLTVPEDTGQVIATNCKNLTIRNLTLSDVSIGIELLNCSHCNISHNTINNNSLHGISLVNTYRRSGNPMLQRSYSNSNIISRNIICNNWDGIMIFNACRNNSISENHFENNTCAINITWHIDYHNYHFPYCYKPLNKPNFLNLFKKLFDLPFFLLFKPNDFRKNNFIENNRYVTFDYDSFLFARWKGNYWNEPQKGPFPIYGTFSGYSWVNYDWHPAQEPFDIET